MEMLNLNIKMKKLLFVLAVALSACGGEASTEVVSIDSTKICDTTKVVESVRAIDTTIIDTLKK
jgi:hypothetical protein